MIYLGPVNDIKKVEKFFIERNFVFTQNSCCVTAVNGQEQLGLCLFELDKQKITILHIEPLNDIPLADGILRSTLHVAAEKSIMDAFYADTVPEEFLEKINFIKEKSEKRLDINKLFQSCCNCK